MQLAAIGGMAMAGGLAGGLAGALGSVPGGALAGNSFLKMMGIKAENESEGSSAHEDSSDTRGTSESRAEGDTRGTSESRAQNVGVGNTRGVQYAFENKAVSEILEAIEQRLARLRSCGGGGAFQCAAYVLAADQATARMGASMYASLLKGDMEASDITYLNVVAGSRQGPASYRVSDPDDASGILPAGSDGEDSPGNGGCAGHLRRASGLFCLAPQAGSRSGRGDPCGICQGYSRKKDQWNEYPGWAT